MPYVLIGLVFAQTSGQHQMPSDASRQLLFVKLQDVKWERMYPEFGDSSPEIAILRVDPKTQATDGSSSLDA